MLLTGTKRMCGRLAASQIARPVVGAGADFHDDQTARRQLGAPGQKLVAAEGAVDENAGAGVNGMHLDHARGEIDADTGRHTSGHLVHGLPLSHDCRLMTHTTNLGASTPLPEGGKSLRIPQQTATPQLN